MSAKTAGVATNDVTHFLSMGAGPASPTSVFSASSQADWAAKRLVWVPSEKHGFEVRAVAVRLSLSISVSPDRCPAVLCAPATKLEGVRYCTLSRSSNVKPAAFNQRGKCRPGLCRLPISCCGKIRPAVRSDPVALRYMQPACHPSDNVCSVLQITPGQWEGGVASS